MASQGLPAASQGRHPPVPRLRLLQCCFASYPPPKWKLKNFGFCRQTYFQAAQNYLPPPPESKIELWVPKSTVEIPKSWKTEENHIYHSLCRLGRNLGAMVVVDSSVLPGFGEINFTGRLIRMRLFCLQLEASCLQWSFFYLQLFCLQLELLCLQF